MIAPLSMRRPHRLVVRTAGFHPANRGSIPRGVTTKNTQLLLGVFCWCVGPHGELNGGW